jgi:hypothetical protein
MPSEVFSLEDTLAQSGDVLLRRIFYPLGFAVCVESNRYEVLSLSEQSWGATAQSSPCEPLKILLEVIDDEPKFAEQEPGWQIEDHILTIIFDEKNFLVADLRVGIAKGRISSGSLNAAQLVRYFLLEAAALSMISTLRATALHAACVDWNGDGLLLCGESGVGKTSLAYACARAGWNYVSDDASYLILGSETREVTGDCGRIRFRDVAHKLFPELTGLPVTPRLTGKPSIEVATEDLDGLRRAQKTRIKYIVFLERDGDTLPALYGGDKKHAQEYFTKFFLQPAKQNRLSRVALDQLLEAEIFELQNTELTWSVSRLRDLMESGQ